MPVKSTSSNSKRPSSAAKKYALSPRLRHGLYWSALAIVAGFGALTLLSENGLLDLIQSKTLYRSLEHENLLLRQQQEELKAETLRLADPRYLEYLARERLGFMRPNEIFVILDEPSGQSVIDN